MSMQDDELLDFDFGGIEPAIPGSFVAMPRGEYQVQCTGAKKFFTGESQGHPDPSKKNLGYDITIINHPLFPGRELRYSDSLGVSSRPFLLNTLMCFIPEIDWQGGKVQINLSELCMKLIGRTANALVIWKIVKSKKGFDIIVNEIQGFKKYDPTITLPEPSQGNPPVLTSSNNSSPVQQQAATGVASPAEVQQFLNEWPGGTPQPAPTPAQPTTDFGF